jgi:hypothetical protein
MDVKTLIEVLGTTASVITAISLTQKNIKRLRILNLIGASAFAIYGFFIKAWPVFGLNAFIAVFDLYYLREMWAKTDDFKVMDFHQLGGAYTEEFLSFFKEDIQRFLWDFHPQEWDSAEGFYILRDMLPAALFVFRRIPNTRETTQDGKNKAISEERGVGKNEAEDLEILFDYAIPAYRDYKNAEFFFSRGVKELGLTGKTVRTAYGMSELHEKYLKKMDFKRTDGVSTEDGRSVFRRTL